MHRCYPFLDLVQARVDLPSVSFYFLLYFYNPFIGPRGSPSSTVCALRCGASEWARILHFSVQSRVKGAHAAEERWRIVNCNANQYVNLYICKYNPSGDRERGTRRISQRRREEVDYYLVEETVGNRFIYIIMDPSIRRPRLLLPLELELELKLLLLMNISNPPVCLWFTSFVR